MPTEPDDAPLKVVAVAGSLRRASHNRRLVAEAVRLAPPGTTVEPLGIAGIPPYDADVEAEGDPLPVASFKAAINAADALLIATPEYNLGIPGVLKNALDWASRPAFESVLMGKAAAVIGGGGGRAGAPNGRAAARLTLEASGARVVDETFVLVQGKDRFDDAGHLVDPAQEAELVAVLTALGALARTVPG